MRWQRKCRNSTVRVLWNGSLPTTLRVGLGGSRGKRFQPVPLYRYGFRETAEMVTELANDK